MEVVRTIPEEAVSSRPVSMTESCCSVEEGKIEMKSLLNNFLTDFKRVYGDTFAEELLDETPKPASPAPPIITSELPYLASCSGSRYFSGDQEGSLHPGIWCDRCGEVSDTRSCSSFRMTKHFLSYSKFVVLVISAKIVHHMI